MANSSKSSKSSSSSSKRSSWGLNKISFWTIVAVTVLYAIALILSACGINATVVNALQGLATACGSVILGLYPISISLRNQVRNPCTLTTEYPPPGVGCSRKSIAGTSPAM